MAPGRRTHASASEPLTAAIRYYDNHGDALFRFVDDPEVPIDNSPTEREFQNVAKLRLNMLFAGSTEGAHRECVLLGIVASCRAQGVAVHRYLSWAFERFGTHRDVFALPFDQLTPAAFKGRRRLNFPRSRPTRIPASLMGHATATVHQRAGSNF
ncbi:MAG: transposase [Labilithrix sp.]|nr:transposase [Labilithrix sp.]